MTTGQDIDTLARTLWGEARGEGIAGMEAVACVVMNRLAVSRQQGKYWWGNTIHDICVKPWQFSCWNESDANSVKILALTPDNDRFFARALEVADRAAGGFLTDPTNGATHYLNPNGMDILPVWARGAPLAVIGRHRFFRPPEVPAPKPINQTTQKETTPCLSTSPECKTSLPPSSPRSWMTRFLKALLNGLSPKS